MDRLSQLKRFYELLTKLQVQLGGALHLASCHGRLAWPARGVYFFFEPGEHRSSTGSGSRVVRVGTHGLKSKSQTTLWNRLSQHRGVHTTGGGNHRGSIFRLLTGEALLNSNHNASIPSWGQGSDPGAAAKQLGLSRQIVKDTELPVEKMVSTYLGKLPFLYVAITDPPGPDSLRGYIERNAIALLSNYQRPTLDSPSKSWLGKFSGRERVRKSGLWNNNHVDEICDADFLIEMEKLIERQLKK